MGKLKGCPFCGKDIESYTISYEGPVATGLEATCNFCHARFYIEPLKYYMNGRGNSNMDAIDIWNMRRDADE